MHPILFKIGNFSIYSYGVMLAVGFLSGTFLAVKEAQRRSIDKELIIDLAFAIIIAGLIGARIFYVISNFSYFRNNPLEIMMLNRGGLVWYGGLIAGTLTLFIFTKIKKVSFLTIADIFAPGLAIGQAFGRIGCFLRGCCYGKPTDSIIGVYCSEQGAKLFPSQIISAIWLVIIFFILKSLSKKKRHPGEIFLAYLILYSLKRFFVEFIRGDSPAVFLGLTSFQLISVLIFVISFSLFLNARRKFKNI